jgi:hypothetical protein
MEEPRREEGEGGSDAGTDEVVCGKGGGGVFGVAGRAEDASECRRGGNEELKRMWEKGKRTTLRCRSSSFGSWREKARKVSTESTWWTF